MKEDEQRKRKVAEYWRRIDPIGRADQCAALIAAHDHVGVWRAIEDYIDRIEKESKALGLG